MPFPDDALTDEEEVVLHLRPHARAAVRPIAVLILALAAVVVAWVMLPPNDGGRIGVAVLGAIALCLALRNGVWPLLVWRCTHYLFTDERILLQDGVLVRNRRDLPLDRVNDHAMSQSVADRVFGSGTLAIDSIGDRVAVLASVPHVQRAQTVLYELIEAHRARQYADDEEDQPVAVTDGRRARGPVPRRAPRPGRSPR